MRRRLAEFLLWVDYRTDGIRLRLFVAAAVAGVPCSRCGTSTCRSRRVAAHGTDDVAGDAELLGADVLPTAGRAPLALLQMKRRKQWFSSSLHPTTGSARPAFGDAVFSAHALGVWPAFISRIRAGFARRLWRCVAPRVWFAGRCGKPFSRLVEDSFGTGNFYDSARRPDLGVPARAVGLEVGRAVLHPARRWRPGPFCVEPSGAIDRPRCATCASFQPVPEVLIERSEPGSYTEVASAFRGDRSCAGCQRSRSVEAKQADRGWKSCRDELAFYLRRARS